MKHACPVRWCCFDLLNVRPCSSVQYLTLRLELIMLLLLKTDVSRYSQCLRVHGYLHVTVTLLCRECECCDLQTACMLASNGTIGC